MRISEWDEYELIDIAGGERLERWGEILLIRPDPQVIWQGEKNSPLWAEAHARYHRSKTGGGSWEFLKPMPESWTIGRRGLTFQLKPMGFKHTGIFPEQAVNWDLTEENIGAAGRSAEQPVKVLNLFGYTGAATMACLRAGAAVTHVDASKGIMQWAKENAELCGLAGKPVRWITDDCMKFVRREERRGNAYDGIIMDPPSYGRGPGGEVWRLEEQLYELIKACLPVMSEAPRFFILNSYATGLSAGVMEYLLSGLVEKRFGGRTSSGEIGLRVSSTGLVHPCGSTAVWECG